MNCDLQSGKEYQIWCVIAVPDGKYLVISSHFYGRNSEGDMYDGSIELWNIENISKPVSINQVKAHHDRIYLTSGWHIMTDRREIFEFPALSAAFNALNTSHARQKKIF